ncbi:MAG: cell division protein FtsL [Deltaproteobacteria bacterium]|nr:cell division protein FtsL [Kofleriaceae bacterium]
MKPRVYRLFRTETAAPPSRRTITVMVLVAAIITALAIMRVQSRHEIVRLGYQLSKVNEDVRQLREAERKLELERATLTNPARINTLAAAMGMAPAPAAAIRVVPRAQPATPIVMSEARPSTPPLRGVAQDDRVAP